MMSFSSAVDKGQFSSSDCQQYPRSLPFKKRRFVPLFDSVVDRPPTLTSALARFVTDRPLELPCVASAESNDEQLAALALVAAAASASCGVLGGTSFPEEPAVEGSNSCGLQKHGFSLQVHDELSSPIISKPSTDLTNVLCAAASFAAAADELEIDQSAGSPGSARLIYRPPLKSPLSDGCHGMTSRNSSYCRRLPRNNGSNYCKLQYQYQVTGTVSEDARAEDSMMVNGQQAQISQQHAASDLVPVVVSATGKNGQAGHHQDKRFTGAEHEARCLATTTRGRACAYVSVNGTKYCYLHADYDTNPAPRRGGTRGSNTAEAFSSSPGSVTSDETSFASKADDITPPSKLARRGISKNMEKAIARAAPCPLLSMLPTDQWFQKKVIISTGPMKDQSGTVEKWGNGWVTVRLAGGDCHNRRSFELYLLPSQQHDVAIEDSAGPGTVASEQGHGSDSVSPASVVMKQVESKSATMAHEVTPCPSKHVIGIDNEHTYDHGRYSQVSNILLIPGISSSSGPNQVPESPAPPKEELPLLTPVAGADLALPAVGNKIEKKRSPRDDAVSSDSKKAAGASANQQVMLKSPPPKVHLSARSSSRSEDDIPLVESLRLAQEGRLEKHKFALLFGTAALNRSRRKAVKPTNYEGSPESQEKKREAAGTFDTGNKRKRLHSGPVLPSCMISSGSEPGGSGDSSVASCD